MSACQVLNIKADMYLMSISAYIISFSTPTNRHIRANSKGPETRGLIIMGCHGFWIPFSIRRY